MQKPDLQYMSPSLKVAMNDSAGEENANSYVAATLTNENKITENFI